MAKYKNIVFFYPSKVTGGAEYYFVHMAQYLSQKCFEYKIFYCDYNDSWTKKIIEGYDIERLGYEEGKKTIIPENSIICISSHSLPTLKNKITWNENNTIISLWFMHFGHLASYFTMDGYFKVGRDTRKRFGKELEKLIDLGLLTFLSNMGNLKLSQQFLYNYREITPVPIPINTEKYKDGTYYPRLQNGVIRFCWLGRLDKEKTRNILTYLNELEQVNKIYKVRLSLIGLGASERLLRKKSKKYSFPIEFVGEKLEEDLDEYIRKNVDIGLASGTSAIEFALRKVPVIQEWIIDKVYKAGVRDTYHFVEEYFHFTDITEYSYRIIGQNKFQVKLKRILENYEECSETSYNYALNRSLDNCGGLFALNMRRLDAIDINESQRIINNILTLVQCAHKNWKEKLHLRRLFVPICKLLRVRPATM